MAITPVYQQEYGAFSVLNRGRLLIADEGGYGKTIQAVDAKKLIELDTGRQVKSLVICPNSAREHWREEITSNHPNERVVILDSYDPEGIESVRDHDFVIINYESLGNKHTRNKVSQALLDMGFEYVVLDEAHHVDNPETFRYEHTREFVNPERAQYVALVTATPGETIEDYYTIVSMLNPWDYSTPDEVRRRYKRDYALIHTALNSQMLRRSADKKSPEPFPFPVTLTGDQEAVYTAVLETEDIDPTTKLDELRKATLDPSLVNPDLIEDPELRKRLPYIESAKYLDLDKELARIVERGEKAVVFTSRFVEGVTRKLEERYKNYGALRIDGSGDVPASYGGKESVREEVRRLFQTNPDHKVLITTPKTMGESISLTAASYVIFLDLPYERRNFYQCIKRIDRAREQQKDVFVAVFEAEYLQHPRGSIDIGIKELLDEKEKVFDIIMNGLRGLSVEEGKLVSGPTVILQQPIIRRLFTTRQQLRRMYSLMIENALARGTGANFNLLYKDDIEGGRQATRLAKDLAEYADEGWEGSYSANASYVLTKLIERLHEAGEKVDLIADLAAGSASLARTLGSPVVNIEFNKEHFERVRGKLHPGNEFIWSKIESLPFKDESFDIASCALSLHWIPEEKKRGKNIEMQREMTIREANRILRKGGHYLIALPDVVEYEEELFYEGLGLLGFDVVKELSGYVKATEPVDSRFTLKLITARKMREPSHSIDEGYFKFAKRKVVTESKNKKRRRYSEFAPQERQEFCEEFAFYDPEHGLEDMDSRLSKYGIQLLREAAEESKRIVSSLPISLLSSTAGDSREYVVRKDSHKGLTTYVPRENVERLIEQLKLNHDGATRREIRKKNPNLYKELRRLKLLHLVSDKKSKS